MIVHYKCSNWIKGTWIMKSDIWIHNKAQQKIPVGRKYCTLLYMCTKIEFLLFGSRKYACELCVACTTLLPHSSLECFRAIHQRWNGLISLEVPVCCHLLVHLSNDLRTRSRELLNLMSLWMALTSSRPFLIPTYKRDESVHHHLFKLFFLKSKLYWCSSKEY